LVSTPRFILSPLLNRDDLKKTKTIIKRVLRKKQSASFVA